jgi:hypothetical protein
MRLLTFHKEEEQILESAEPAVPELLLAHKCGQIDGLLFAPCLNTGEGITSVTPFS